MKKETFKTRMTAEAFYNELWQIDTEMKEIKHKYLLLKKRREQLNKINRIDLK